MPRRLSLNERTLRLAQPPSSLGTLLKRLRSTFRLVSFFSLPSERGSDFKRFLEIQAINQQKNSNQDKLNGLQYQCAHLSSRCVTLCFYLLTCNRFSVKTSSVRFSHSPTVSVRWVSLFWSTFKMDSCFRQPDRETNANYITLMIHIKSH